MTMAEKTSESTTAARTHVSATADRVEPETIQAIDQLITKWQGEAAARDAVHATMGIGWKMCIYDLSALRDQLLQSQAGTPQRCMNCDGTANLMRVCGDCHEVFEWHKVDQAGRCGRCYARFVLKEPRLKPPILHESRRYAQAGTGEYTYVEQACRGCMGPCGRCHESQAGTLNTQEQR